MDYKKKTLDPVQLQHCETLRRTPQTLRQKKTPPSTTQTLLQKKTPPGTNQTLRNPAQNSANPASKKTLHPVQLQSFMPGSYYNHLRRSLIL